MVHQFGPFVEHHVPDCERGGNPTNADSGLDTVFVTGPSWSSVAPGEGDGVVESSRGAHADTGVLLDDPS